MSIIDQLFGHAEQTPEALAFRFLTNGDGPGHELSFTELLQDAAGVAQFLTAQVPKGSPILLLFSPGIKYVTAFYGCLLAGMIAVPLYPPRNAKSDRVIKVAQSCQAKLALTTDADLGAIQSAIDAHRQPRFDLRIETVDAISAACPFGRHVVAAQPDQIAFLQYTSGSTGIPKGVMISHGNIVANMQHLSLMSTGNHDDVFVNWLPLFHDLGLVTAVLWPTYLGTSSTLMSPASFVREPLTWLKAITKYRGTMCGAPNFAYELCTQRVPESAIAELDLSSWRVAYNAAEPVRASTLDAFVNRFSRCGFSERAFYPAYGMAEATVFISGGQSQHEPICVPVNRSALADQRILQPESDTRLATRIVACGRADYPHQIRIVDPDTRRELLEGQVGEIWFAGPSVSPGYWELPEVNAQTFGQSIVGDEEAGSVFLRTGDLGLLHEGEVYVVGRLKDMIIVHGRNFYPQDIELTVEQSHPSIFAGHVAAFSISDDKGEHLVVVAEVEREYVRKIDAPAVIGAIRRCVYREHEVEVSKVVLLRPYRMPMTSSGKIQRKKACMQWLAGELDVMASDSYDEDTHYDPPATVHEAAVAEIWQKVLGRERVGVREHFVELGGNSLMAMEVSALIQERYRSLGLNLDHILELPTVELVAAYIERQAQCAAPTLTSDSGETRKLVRL